MIPFRYRYTIAYWRIRKKLLGLRFVVSKESFRLRKGARRTRETTGLVGQLIWLAAPALLTTVVWVGLVALADYALTSAMSSVTSLPVIGRLHLFYLHLAQALAGPGSGAVTTVLAALAAIAGVFLGLFFTAISVTAAATYASAPMNVARLLQQDRPSIHYVSTLVQVMGASLLLLCAGAMGLSVGPLALVAVLVVASYAVYGFFTLAWNVFGAFDPNRLCLAALEQMTIQVRYASAKGNRWKDPSFQDYYRKEAARDVEAVVSLMRMSSDKATLRRDSLIQTMTQAAQHLTWYAGARRRIPPSSRWYGLAPQHTDWFLADYTEVQLARAVCSDLTPKLVPRPHWVEDRIGDAILVVLEGLVRTGDRGLLADCATPLAKWLRSLAANLELDYAASVLARLRQLVQNSLAEDTDHLPVSVSDVNLVEILAYIHIEAVLGVFDSIRNKEYLDGLRTSSSRDLRGEGAYGGRFAPPVLAHIERLSDRLEFEDRVGDTPGSPEWYLRQIVISAFLKTLEQQIPVVLDTVKAYFNLQATGHSPADNPSLTAAHLHRALELLWKTRAGLVDTQATWQELIEARVEPSLDWPDLNWAMTKNENETLRIGAITKLAENLPKLATAKRDKKHPDLFGRSYEFVCLECFRALQRGDDELLNVAFAPLLTAATVAIPRVLARAKHLEVGIQTKAAVQPLIDAVELSGFSMVYAELHDKPRLHEIVRDAWGSYLDRQDDGSRALDFIVQTYSQDATGIPIMPRAILRTEWRQTLSQELSKRGLVEPGLTQSYPPRAPNLPGNKKVLQHLCRHGSAFVGHIGDYFIVSDLMRSPHAVGVKYPDRWGIKRALFPEATPED